MSIWSSAIGIFLPRTGIKLHARRLVRLLAHERVACPRLFQKIGLMTSSFPAVKLSVDKSECLVDEDIVVKITGLKPNERVTVLATTEVEGKHFWSHGLFCANDRGVVDLSTATPISGSYDEADTNGLLWSMAPAPWLPPHQRMFQPTAVKPRTITFRAFPESNSPSEYLKDKEKVLASVEHKRWHKAQNTRRIPINHPRIQGTVFLPEGPGPFPGVIDLYGVLVSISEGRAALLASHGFATMALSYIHGKGLPQSMQDIELNYFEEAAKWFASLPEVRSDGLGVFSLCFGSSPALWMAQSIPNIRAVVNVSGIPFTQRFWKHNGRDIGSNTYIDEAGLQTRPEGMSIANAFVVPDDSYLKPWTHGARLLSIVSDKDLLIPTRHTLRLYEEIMPQDYRYEKAELVIFPGAGHHIEPPHAPLFRFLYGADRAQMAFNVKKRKYQHNNLLIVGGNPKEHAAAQTEAWQRGINFLRTHLM